MNTKTVMFLLATSCQNQQGLMSHHQKVKPHLQKLWLAILRI
nr:MAG TPA: hypothetical protein [Caudoviricetes sp.]